MATTLSSDDTRLAEVPELIPVRMLNEFTYCPRLACLEWVQGEFTDNLDTIEGRFGHRRVDQPSSKPVPAADQAAPQSPDPPNPDAPAPTPDAIHSRSLMLSAPVEGLIANLDLLELAGDVATPVDYKRGHVPNTPEQSWEPERVQLCAQGLILREAGYRCDQGVLYYIESRRRVTIEFDDALVARTRDLVVALRAVAAAGVMPPPLVDSPKCPRCSLVGICLPDELNLLSQAGPAADDPPDDDAPATVRRLIPPHDDALPLYIQDQGVTLGKDGDRLSIKQKGQLVRDVKLKDVSQVCLFGNVQVTAQALREISARNIPVCHFSYGGWLHALTTGLVHKNIDLRIRQFAAAADPRQSLDFARRFVVGKIKNSRTLLRRHLPDDPDHRLDHLAEFAHDAERAPTAETLLGVEGMAAKTYFGGFARLLKGDAEFDFNGRNRRPPTDPCNALLSFVYALLVRQVTVTLQSVGFEPLLGFYHRPRYGRPSLALDLAEEFRPIVADSVVLTLINNGEVAPASFLRRAGAIALTDAGRKAVIAAFERRLETEITHPIFEYRVSYRRILEVQARLLARVLLGELAEYPSFCTR